MPNSSAVASPSWRIFSHSSERTFSTISSMRAGWMRPSTMSFSSARRATSRRSGSKAEMTIASGVSSMIRSTPVAASSARMLRPSRPMMRPFRSSEGSSTTDTVASTTVSEASRWIAMPMMRRAFWVACSMASSSIRRISPAASTRASFSIGLDEVALGVDRRQARDLLEPLALLVDDRLDLGLPCPRASSAGPRRPSPCGRIPLPGAPAG